VQPLSSTRAALSGEARRYRPGTAELGRSGLDETVTATPFVAAILAGWHPICSAP
jgi:hypothetical protein